MAWARKSFFFHRSTHQTPPSPPAVALALECVSGRQRYAIDITCTTTAFPPEELAADHRPTVPRVDTKFLHPREPVNLGDRIDGWRVCWRGGWDRGKVFFVVMVERVGAANR